MRVKIAKEICLAVIYPRRTAYKAVFVRGQGNVTVIDLIYLNAAFTKRARHTIVSRHTHLVRKAKHRARRVSLLDVCHRKAVLPCALKHRF